MGRKIPGRKHRGVRDPEKQRADRFKKIKDKINAPPSNPDEQQVPKSLLKIAELKEKVKNGAFKRKRRKVRPQIKFEQRSHETDREFLLRVNRECAVVQHEAAFEQKFGVEIEKNKQGDIIGVKKRPKDPVQIMLKEAKRKKNVKKAKSNKDEGLKLTKSQKRRAKLLEKKKRKQAQNVDEFERFQDKPKFGEQVHAPPTLTVPKNTKKVNDSDGVPRPGKKNLLLKSLLHKTNNKTIDKTGKRKDLPNALRRQLDKQQKEIIEAYRLIKGKKRNIVQ